MGTDRRLRLTVRYGLSILTAARGARKALGARLWCRYTCMYHPFLQHLMEHNAADRADYITMMDIVDVQVIHPGPYRYLGYRVFGQQYLGDIWCANKRSLISFRLL